MGARALPERARSVTSTTVPFPTSRATFIESTTGHPAKFPSTAPRRWALRLGVALPFVGLAVLYGARGASWSVTANGALHARVSGLVWDSPDIDGLRELYPPVTSIVGLLTPGGALGLAVVGSFFAGVLFQLLLQSMRRKEFPLAVQVAYLLALATTPAFAFVVTTNLEATLSAVFFGVGMIDLVRFVTYANTQAGFRAGLLFAGAALSDRMGLLTVFSAVCTSLLIIRSRPGSRRANAIVVMFPTVALVASFMVLGIAFRVGPVAAIAGHPAWDPARATQTLHYLGSADGLVGLAPMIIVIIAAVGLRYPWVALAAVLLTAMPLLAYVLGLAPPGTAGTTYVLTLLFAAAVAPRTLTRMTTGLVLVLAGALWVVGWLTVLVNPTMNAWLSVLTGVGS